MKTNKYLNLNTAMTVAFVVVAFWLLAVKNGYMLRWMDELSLFVPTRIFFRQFAYYPGGLLRYAGTWLTQLLYYPWLGVSVLIALWLILALLTGKAFRFSKEVALLALLVPTVLLVSVAQIDEAWLTLKTPGYIYSNTLGYLFTVAATLLFSKASSRPALAAIIAAISALCYPIAGFYALLGAALCAVMAIIIAIREKRYLHFITVAVAIALIILIPQIYYTYFHGNTVDNDYLYLKGLPELLMLKFDIYLWTPFIVATAILLLIAILSGIGWLKGSLWLKWISIAAVCCGLVWGVKASKKSEQLRATVLMLQRLDRSDWEGIASVMSRIKEQPNYTMRLLNNLALFNLGVQGESMSKYSPAPGDGRHSEKFTTTAFINVPVYYNIGRINQSYRWAMEHTVQYGKRVFFLKYMVKSSLLRKEIPLARRYNDILLSTMFHREWAEQMQKFIDNPELIDSDPDFQRILNFGVEDTQLNEGSTEPVH